MQLCFSVCGPRGGGIYSIIEDVVCQAYVLRIGSKTNNCGYMQFCLCLWSLSGPGVGYIQLLRTVCVKYICLKHIPMRHLPIGDIYQISDKSCNISGKCYG